MDGMYDNIITTAVSFYLKYLLKLNKTKIIGVCFTRKYK